MKLTLDRKLTPAEIAEAFCELDDEQQAQVFIEIGRVAEGWKASGGLPTMTWHSVGRPSAGLLVLDVRGAEGSRGHRRCDAGDVGAPLPRGDVRANWNGRTSWAER